VSPVVTPEPDDEEAAAIAAAVTQLFSGGPAASPGREPVSRWRFSGRWWSRPVPRRRARPWA
jgi:hypothetical protein